MTEKQITKIIKEWIEKTKFPYGWEDGFLDTTNDCELHWEDTEESRVALIENYLLYGNWECKIVGNKREKLLLKVV